MEIRQQKSTCCSARVRRYGGKRRQCAACKQTWRVYPAKRGPKKRRPDVHLLELYRCNCIGSLAAHAQRTSYTPSTIQRRVVSARESVVRAAAKESMTCVEPHILLADALHQKIGAVQYVTYLILVRPLRSNRAAVCATTTARGAETGIGWQRALSHVPSEMLAQTRALVSDGHRGLLRIARQRGWVQQRCCFHVLKELNKNMRLWHRATPETYWVHELVHIVLESPDDERVSRVLGLLSDYAMQTPRTEVASILRGLVQNFRDYRSYLYYPELHLPATNNSCESSFRRVRALQNKARGWRTPTAYEGWVTYVLRNSKDVQCLEGQPKLCG
ncbi:MAG: transposase [Candidatus Saccharimonadales bacterium]